MPVAAMAEGSEDNSNWWKIKKNKKKTFPKIQVIWLSEIL